MSRLRVVVIGGGRNGEHEVSLASAAAVARALDPRRYDVVPLTIDRAGDWRGADGEALGLRRAIDEVRACDLVIPVVHGRHGEDGTLAALCELAGTRYVGSGVTAGAIGMDKHLTKLVANSVGVPTARGVLLRRENAHAYRFREPVVVKPVTAGSSLGVTLVHAASELPGAIDAALAFDDRVLVEQVVVGREIDIAVVRRADGSMLVSPALEIEHDGLFDHEAKYDGRAVFHVPARLDVGERWELERAAVRLYDALDCAGLVRLDFFLTADGPVLNEVNTTPGLTAESQVPRMFRAAGVSYPQLLDLLVDDALAGPPPGPVAAGLSAQRAILSA
ncbi:D-alanine--D-alanine ligase [Herbiconiux daphne]|uniref:D-alanine--D-alanine ligase n=1 Tax=Herbiconiux daphne TaxID=2970914 RepID=A0ABT2GZW8_9MICO|nr:D-alanine--D-alanine ligase [Herbiconiux daphne]MCS5732912.1 D-alanine--D-alanine ligase [Herbiconiux daphne]